MVAIAQLQPRVLGNFKFTYTSAGNLHTQVLANAIANLPIHGKYIPLTKNNENIALQYIGNFIS